MRNLLFISISLITFSSFAEPYGGEFENPYPYDEVYSKCFYAFGKTECDWQKQHDYPWRQAPKNSGSYKYFASCNQYYSQGFCNHEAGGYDASIIAADPDSNNHYCETSVCTDVELSYKLKPKPSTSVETSKKSICDEPGVCTDAELYYKLHHDTGGTAATNVKESGTIEGDSSSPTTQESTPAETVNKVGGYSAERDQILSEFDQCEEQLRKTKSCCEHPEQCMGEALGGSATTSSSIFGALQAVAGGMAQAASISGSCGKMQNVATGFAMINAALSFQCTTKVNQCKKACGDLRTSAKNLLARCQTNKAECAGMAQPPLRLPAGATAAESANLQEDKRVFNESLSEGRAQLQKVVDTADMCERLDNAALQQAQQAIASALTAKLMGLCKKEASTPDAVATAPVQPNAFDLNCADPANYSNPMCQSGCSRPGAQNDPACRPNGGVGFGDGQTALVNPNGNSSMGLDEFENGQQALTGDIAPVGATSKNGRQGGGGLPGGGGGTGSASGGARGAAAEAEGYNTGILSGTRGGGGYVQPLGAPGGGVANSGERAPANEKGKSFNPKDFLPGGRLDPKRRLAGLASNSPEIGAVHGDIFKNITNRFYQVCLRNGLYDCDSLRKSARQGN